MFVWCLMRKKVIEHKPYDRKVDVFSFSIVLWELLTGKVIFWDCFMEIIFPMETFVIPNLVIFHPFFKFQFKIAQTFSCQSLIIFVIEMLASI